MAGSMDSKITQINPETGEVIEGVLVWMPKKRVSPFERHFTMNQAGLLLLAQNLTGEQLKVLLTLLADLDYENYIQVTQTDIAEKLSMIHGNVRCIIHRAKKKLEPLKRLLYEKDYSTTDCIVA